MKDEVTKIQATWISYKVRKRITNIYKRLPDDLQRIVLHHLNKKDILRRLYTQMYYVKICKLERNLIELYRNYLIESKISIEEYISKRLVISSSIDYYIKRLVEII